VPELSDDRRDSSQGQVPTLSVVIPAYNEGNYLPVHLPTVVHALRRWERESGESGEIIVVDNASTDDTAAVARGLGAQVVAEIQRNIGRVRNAGARASRGDYLFFIDADVTVPVEAFAIAMQLMVADGHAGGAIAPVYHCKRRGARMLCRYWDWYRSRSGGAQGVAQFCTAWAFEQLGGYRGDLYMSEDVDFFARLRILGTMTGRPVAVVDKPRVEPSTRRYDGWPTWRMVLWQNPITARMRLTSPHFWRHWYETTVR
jgi:glycosyltransferase involved in cell wall biosynthesis